MSGEHARLSASRAHRWLVCTPCVQLEEQFEEQTSVYAEEGTFAHALAEVEINDKLRFIGVQGYEEQKASLLDQYAEYDTEELREGVERYVEVVSGFYREAQKNGSDVQLLLEQQVDFSQWVREGFGTADAILIGEGVLHIIDLKYGKHRVEAEDNPQLKLYALGAYQTYGMLYPIGQVRMTIIQPRLKGVRSSELMLEDLLDWGETVVKPRAEEAFEGKGEYFPGNHCHFCKAGRICRARGEAHLALLKETFQTPEVFGDEEMGELLTQVGKLVNWAKELTDYAYEQVVVKGKSYPGWKLVEGRRMRKYKDTEQVVKILEGAGYEESVIMDKQLITLTAMEKLLGKKSMEQLLGEWLIKSAGKPVLVPEADKRPRLIQKGEF